MISLNLDHAFPEYERVNAFAEQAILKLFAGYPESQSHVEVKLFPEMSDHSGGYTVGNTELAFVTLTTGALGQDYDIDNLVLNLAHELTHARQWITGELEQPCTWKGQDCSEIPYEDQPWETEAYMMQYVLINEFWQTQEQGDMMAQELNTTLVDDADPILHKPATIDPFDTMVDWQEEEGNMVNVMYYHRGLGLAAPQLGHPFRMFVMQHSEHGPIGVYNPLILESNGTITQEEGCLTWPMLYLQIERATSVLVKYSNKDGKTVTELMEGIDARCFQHELDHLNGINFIDDVGDFKLKRAQEARKKRLKKQGRMERKSSAKF